MTRATTSPCKLPKITINVSHLLRSSVMWTKPAATEMRFGFEVTMYIMNK